MAIHCWVKSKRLASNILRSVDGWIGMEGRQQGLGIHRALFGCSAYVTRSALRIVQVLACADISPSLVER